MPAQWVASCLQWAAGEKTYRRISLQAATAPRLGGGATDDGYGSTDDDYEWSASQNVTAGAAAPRHSRGAVVLWPAVVVFTADDWDVAQPIRLRGLPDIGASADASGISDDDGAGDATVVVTLTRVGATTGDLIYDARLARATSSAPLARHAPAAAAGGGGGGDGGADPPGRGRLIVAYGPEGVATSEGETEVTTETFVVPFRLAYSAARFSRYLRYPRYSVI